MPARLSLLKELGGLPAVAAEVKNDEWLYLLGDETRNSIAIEGYFATEEELEATIAGRRTAPEIMNYFRTAQFLYGAALQNHREGEIDLRVVTIRQINSELFRNMNGRQGEFRLGPIRISGAKVKPPTIDVDDYMRAFVRLSLDILDQFPILNGLARVHALFESIHPFEDGNGRTGRILMNYLAISRGLPPIVIKGLTTDERQLYYDALEAADRGFHDGFPEPTPDALRARLAGGNFVPLETMLCEGLLSALDSVITGALRRSEPLMGFPALARHFGVKEVTLRQWVSRDKLIAVKQQGRLFSHPRLYLGGLLPSARSRAGG